MTQTSPLATSPPPFFPKQIFSPPPRQDEDHTAFVEKYGFNQLTLLSDVGGAVRKAYEVPASLFGALDGRVTYVVAKDGEFT
jgi:peroxiredoxin